MEGGCGRWLLGWLLRGLWKVDVKGVVRVVVRAVVRVVLKGCFEVWL